jgi:hypothetical protein
MTDILARNRANAAAAIGSGKTGQRAIPGLRALRDQLLSGNSAALIVQSDSTSYNSYNYPAQIAALMGQKLPGIRVQTKLWDHANQRYSSWSVVQAGASGERYVSFGTGGAQRARVTGSSPDTFWTTDLDLRVKINPTTWTPAADQFILCMSGASQAFKLALLGGANAGKVYLEWNDQSNTTSYNSANTAVPYTDGTTAWIRATVTFSGNTATTNLITAPMVKLGPT